MLKIFIVLAAVLSIISGFLSFNNEPSLLLTLFFGISLSSYFLLVAIRDWSQEVKIGSYIFILASIAIFIVMVNSAMNY
ncbi:hypothetical protein DHX103_10025 [Planococcus sp. X10-3]|uniref:hypothetical protein n=1 Tax=Planococcus sp. X10-3 TaxID=3061240 RepID=UPI003BB0D352